MVDTSPGASPLPALPVAVHSATPSEAARRALCVLHRAEINGTAGGNPGARRDRCGQRPGGRRGKADRGRGRLGRFSGNAFQQRQIVQELRIGVFQKALLARSVNVLHGLVNLRRRRIQDHAVDRGAAQGHLAARRLEHERLKVCHHIPAHVVNGLVVDERHVRGVLNCANIRHLLSPPWEKVFRCCRRSRSLPAPAPPV